MPPHILVSDDLVVHRLDGRIPTDNESVGSHQGVGLFTPKERCDEYFQLLEYVAGVMAKGLKSRHSGSK